MHGRRREAHRSGPLPVERRHGGAPAARFIAELLRPLIARWLQRERRNAFTGANTFFYFVEGDPKRYRAPDVYVIDGVPQDAPEVGSWKTWEGHRPSFALEIVGDDYKKDYRDAPADYDAKGVAEAVIFDPWATAKSRKRVRWQVFRRVARKGLICVETSMEDRVQSRSLGAWLRRVDVDGHTRLRVGYGERGEELVPTDEEVAEAERTVRRVIEAQANAERLARQTAEEHARAVEAELAAVRAELERLRRGG
ncbi:MAG: Uma2 family endonuclease [Polyangiales bacterium]